MAATDPAIEAALSEFSSQNPHRASFLAPPVRVSRRRKDIGSVKHEGHVAMALGRRHWSEECLQLTWNELLLLRPADKYVAGLDASLATAAHNSFIAVVNLR